MADYPVREAADEGRLEGAVERLLDQQSRDWPLLAEGIRGLTQAQTRRLGEGPGAVALRHIPHRMKSTTARVDAASIAARPCFLCAANLPPEQQGVAFGPEWVVLANPFPILPRHLTIVAREHTPQRLAGRVDALLGVARGLPRSFVIYNGPQCGASAPDHLHLQACDRGLLPIAGATPPGAGPFVIAEPCRALVLQGGDRARLVTEIERLMTVVAEVVRADGEPMVNVAAYWADARFTAYVFPRAKHRPEAYHTGERLVSPASIDLCGVLVAPRAADYEALTDASVRAIYDEVMVPGTALQEMARRMGWRS